jgi:Mrp family chromosome partitioning ATPase
MIDLPLHQSELEQLYLRTVGAGLRSIAVTAPDIGAGVSTIAWGLARRAAAGGRRTLLVEFNSARPMLARQADVRALDWSLHDSSAEGALVPLQGELLTVLPAPLRMSTNLASREKAVIEAALCAWMARFDLVVCDVPSVNGQHPGNLPVHSLCAACDGTLLVVLAGRTRANDLETAANSLAAGGARVCGCVANDRFNPSLARELSRETRRLDRHAPRIARWIRRRIARNELLALRA